MKVAQAPPTRLGPPTKARPGGRAPHTCQRLRAGAHSPPHRSRPRSPPHHCTGTPWGYTRHWHSGAQPLGTGALPDGDMAGWGRWLRAPTHPSCPLPSLPPPAQPVPGSQPSSSTRRGLPGLASLRGAAWRCPSEGHTRTCRACTIRANIHTVEAPSQFSGKSYKHRGVCSGCHRDPAQCAPHRPSPQPPWHGMDQAIPAPMVSQHESSGPLKAEGLRF